MCGLPSRSAVRLDIHWWRPLTIMVKNLQPILAAVTGVLVCASVVCCDNRQIRKFSYNNNGFGVYSFEYATSDGTYRREEGGSSPGTDNLLIRGEFGYIDPTGKLYSVRFIADENGYRPLTKEDTRFNDRNIV